MPSLSASLDVARVPGFEWADSDRRIWVVAEDGSLQKTDRFAPDRVALARNAVMVSEREQELKDWKANIALYADSTAKMRDSTEQWRQRAHEYGARVEKPSQRWAWGLGGAVVGYTLMSIFGRKKGDR